MKLLLYICMLAFAGLSVADTVVVTDKGVLQCKTICDDKGQNCKVICL